MIERICVVSDYSMTTLGGAETAYFEQVRTLGEHYQVTAMSSGCPRLTELGTFPGVTAVAVPIWFRLPIRGLPITRITPSLVEFFVDTFRQRRIQLVHIHSEFAIAAAALAAARELGIPVVHTIHTFFWQTNWPIQRLLGWLTPPYHWFVTGLSPTRDRLDAKPGNSAMRNMTLTMARAVDAIISPSAHQARRLRDTGLTKVTVVPNAMEFPKDAEPLTEVSGPLRVLWIGRFVAEKRVLPFLRSCLSALESLPPGSLEIDVVGDGEEFRKAEALVAGQSAIRLHGRVPHAEVQQLVARSHVTALTSFGWDNQPMVIVESITALRGVLYCDPELTEGLTGSGILALGPGEDEFAALLVRLVTEPSLVVAASAAAVSARAEFSVESYLRRTSQVYRSVMV